MWRKSILESNEDNTYITPEIAKRIEDVFLRAKAIPETEYFGMINGDFNAATFLVDGNNIWPFDFSHSCYSYFLLDVANTLFVWLTRGYSVIKNKTCRQTLYEDILPYFKIGYSFQVDMSAEHWNYLELFLTLTTCRIFYTLNIYSTDTNENDLLEITAMVAKILSYPDIFEGLDAVIADACKLV